VNPANIERHPIPSVRGGPNSIFRRLRGGSAAPRRTFARSGRKSGNTESGLYLAHAAGVEVDNVEVTGFRDAGIRINGLQGARITRVHAHENGYAGICSAGDTSRNVYVGRCADPLLRKDGTGLLSDPTGLRGLSEYELLPASPAIDSGLDLRKLFGVDPGTRDFYGNTIPQGKGYDIGADENVAQIK